MFAFLAVVLLIQDLRASASGLSSISTAQFVTCGTAADLIMTKIDARTGCPHVSPDTCRTLLDGSVDGPTGFTKGKVCAAACASGRVLPKKPGWCQPCSSTFPLRPYWLSPLDRAQEFPDNEEEEHPESGKCISCQDAAARPYLGMAGKIFTYRGSCLSTCPPEAPRVDEASNMCSSCPQNQEYYLVSNAAGVTEELTNRCYSGSHNPDDPRTCPAEAPMAAQVSYQGGRYKRCIPCPESARFYYNGRCYADSFDSLEPQSRTRCPPEAPYADPTARPRACRPCPPDPITGAPTYYSLAQKECVAACSKAEPRAVSGSAAALGYPTAYCERCGVTQDTYGRTFYDSVTDRCYAHGWSGHQDDCPAERPIADESTGTCRPCPGHYYPGDNTCHTGGSHDPANPESCPPGGPFAQEPRNGDVKIPALCVACSYPKPFYGLESKECLPSCDREGAAVLEPQRTVLHFVGPADVSRTSTQKTPACQRCPEDTPYYIAASNACAARSATVAREASVLLRPYQEGQEAPGPQGECPVEFPLARPGNPAQGEPPRCVSCGDEFYSPHTKGGVCVPRCGDASLHDGRYPMPLDLSWQASCTAATGDATSVALAGSAACGAAAMTNPLFREQSNWCADCSDASKGAKPYWNDAAGECVASCYEDAQGFPATDSRSWCQACSSGEVYSITLRRCAAPDAAVCRDPFVDESGSQHTGLYLVPGKDGGANTCSKPCPPESSFLDVETRTCLPQCPQDKRYYDSERSCYKECPVFRPVLDGTSLRCSSCSELDVNGSQGSGQYYYLPGGDAGAADSCRKACPPTAVAVQPDYWKGSRDFLCRECLGSTPYIFNGDCVGSCPSAAPVLVDGVCMSCTALAAQRGTRDTYYIPGAGSAEELCRDKCPAGRIGTALDNGDLICQTCEDIDPTKPYLNSVLGTCYRGCDAKAFPPLVYVPETDSCHSCTAAKPWLGVWSEKKRGDTMQRYQCFARESECQKHAQCLYDGPNADVVGAAANASALSSDAETTSPFSTNHLLAAAGVAVLGLALARVRSYLRRPQLPSQGPLLPRHSCGVSNGLARRSSGGWLGSGNGNANGNGNGNGNGSSSGGKIKGAASSSGLNLSGLNPGGLSGQKSLGGGMLKEPLLAVLRSPPAGPSPGKGPFGQAGGSPLSSGNGYSNGGGAGAPAGESMDQYLRRTQSHATAIVSGNAAGANCSTNVAGTVATVRRSPTPPEPPKGGLGLALGPGPGRGPSTTPPPPGPLEGPRGEPAMNRGFTSQPIPRVVSHAGFGVLAAPPATGPGRPSMPGYIPQHGSQASVFAAQQQQGQAQTQGRPSAPVTFGSSPPQMGSLAATAAAAAAALPRVAQMAPRTSLTGWTTKPKPKGSPPPKGSIIEDAV